MKYKKVYIEGIDMISGKKVKEVLHVPEDQDTVTTKNTYKGPVHVGTKYPINANKGKI